MEARDRLGGDVLQDELQVGLRIEVAQLRCSDQRVHCRGTFTASVCAGEEVILPSERYGTQRTFRRGVVDLDAAIIAVAHKRCPARERIADRAGELRLLRQQSYRIDEEAIEIIQQR